MAELHSEPAPLRKCSFGQIKKNYVFLQSVWLLKYFKNVTNETALPFYMATSNCNCKPIALKSCQVKTEYIHFNYISRRFKLKKNLKFLFVKSCYFAEVELN